MKSNSNLCMPRKICNQIKVGKYCLGHKRKKVIEKRGSDTLLGLIFAKISLSANLGQIRENKSAQKI